MVSEPDQIQVDEIPGTEENVIELRLADQDIGKIIGKNGSVIRAIRTLIGACSVKDQKNYQLEIID
ncbi:MAG: KH domain-containing protein [Spirochaetales bacterium]|nr:KH domain-containing protein [Spirochaetales bacterium]